MVCGIVMAVLQPVFATYGEKILTAKQQIGAGLLISGISLIAFPFFGNEIYVYVLIVTFATGGAIVTPNLLSAVSLLSKEKAGSNISVQTSANSVGQILGPVIGTWLITGGFYFPFIIAGIIILTAIGLLYFYKSFNSKTTKIGQDNKVS